MLYNIYKGFLAELPGHIKQVLLSVTHTQVFLLYSHSVG